MAKKQRWIISAPGSHPATGGKALITSKADLDRRVKEAKAAGVTVNVRPVED